MQQNMETSRSEQWVTVISLYFKDLASWVIKYGKEARDRQVHQSECVMASNLTHEFEIIQKEKKKLDLVNYIYQHSLHSQFVTILVFFSP